MHSPIFDIGGVIVGALLRAQARLFAITNWAVKPFLSTHVSIQRSEPTHIH